MRVLIDLTSLADNLSGIERYAACLTLELIKNRDIDFILIFKEGIPKLFQKFIYGENITHEIVPRYKKLYFSQWILPKVINKYKADWYLFLAFPVPLLLYKKNMISTIHDICCWDCPETMKSISKWYFRISHKIAIRKCSNIITISDFSKKQILDYLHYNENKLWVLYCGVDKKFLNNSIENNHINEKMIYSKYNLPTKYILSLSTLEPRKNLVLLVQAYQKLVLQNSISIPLVLAGRKGWKMDALLTDIDDRVIPKIIFTNFVEDKDLPKVYNGAELFVFPSKYEGFGMPPLEAMACSTLVLSSDATSLPEVLGKAALYFKSEDVISLANKLYQALNLELKDKEEYIKLGKERVMEFNWEKEGQKLYALLKNQ